MLFYVITYDISCNKRRNKVAKLLEGYGQRVQYSVFECQLSDRKCQELQKRLQKRVKLSEDSIRFYPLSKHTLSGITIWGEPPLSSRPSSVII